jgi:hypothetical protein
MTRERQRDDLEARAITPCVEQLLFVHEERDIAVARGPQTHVEVRRADALRHAEDHVAVVALHVEGAGTVDLAP